MANASRDENSVTTILGIDSTNGISIVKITADPATHGLTAQDGTTGTDFGSNTASRDENFVTTLLAVSEADGVTPVELYVDAATGALLIDNN